LRAKKWLDASDIVFQPGLNEELAATAIWGAQQAELRGDGKYDGVFGVWYGKGPGVDRSGDVFRHANMAGSSKHGGVLALMGDDHTAESSTVAHQSEFHFVDVMIPILNPAGVQEILDYGLYGYRHEPLLRLLGRVQVREGQHRVDASVDGSLDRVKIVMPDDFAMPSGGLNIRTPDAVLDQEAAPPGLQARRHAGVRAAQQPQPHRALRRAQPKVGIITVGKSYLDVRQAMDELGLDEVKANDMGLRLYKVACPWPLSQRELVEFAQASTSHGGGGEAFADRGAGPRGALRHRNQPICIGKKDEQGQWLFPVKGALDPNDIAIALGERLLRHHRNDELAGGCGASRRRSGARRDE
jgi:indolepyruvate ferredoxin oxidoreductase